MMHSSPPQKYSRAFLLNLLVAAALVLPAAGAIIYTDNTFNLADYSQVNYQNNGAVTISWSQVALGNPGAGLQIQSQIPAGNEFTSTQGFINGSFTYNPAVDGALQSIDISMDKFTNYSLAFSLTSNAARPLLQQNGNYYVVAIPVPTTFDTWLTAAQSGLVANDFSLFDFTTGTTDTSQHPNFAGSVMRFGLANRAGLAGGPFPDSVLTNRYDNYRVQLNGVPEPASVMLLALGSGGVLSLRPRRRQEGSQK